MKTLRQFLHLCTCVLLLFLKIASSRSPHIIFILVDDLGWNDVSFHGSKQIPTPNIDSLAYDGVILNNYYVQPICTPSRSSLMTGKYPIRLGLQHDVIYADAPYGLSPKEKVLPQYLKELGYATHGIGKWHLGFFHKSYLPVNRGFDSFFGYWSGKGDFYTHFEEGQGTHGLDLHDNNENARNYTSQYGTDLFTSKAKDIIENHNASEPLFLYVAHQAVHAGNSYTPLQAPLESVKKFLHIKDEPRRKFAGMVSNLDDNIGDLISALDDARMLDNSVIIFSTDNGGAVEGIDQSTGSNWPLRGSKYNMWEGGVRGVSFVWSPLLSSTSKVSSHLMHVTDWLPTLYSVAGGDLKKLPTIDGLDLWPSICCNVSSPRKILLHNIDSNWNVEAIRADQYKLLKGSVFGGKFDGWFDKEGKHKENVPYTEKEVETFMKVYSQMEKGSIVKYILQKIQNKNVRNNHCCATPNPNTCHSEDNCIKLSLGALLRNPSNPSTVEVDCGKNVSNSCKPMESACLFDVVSDPCEYNNLAKSLPEEVKRLEGYLDKYRAEAVPIRNKPCDPAANPKFHEYAWVPWVKEL